MIPVHIKHRLVIQQPIKEVFAYISNLENLVEWSSSAITIRKLTSGAVQAGAMVQLASRFLGKWQNLTFEVVEYDPCRWLTIKSLSGVAPCHFSYQFESAEERETVVSQEAMISLTEGRVVQPAHVVISALRRSLDCDLLTLKDLLEARACRGGQYWMTERLPAGSEAIVCAHLPGLWE